MTTISKEQAKNLIERNNCEIFKVTFTKKDGSIRDMVCRRNVTAHLKGGVLKYDPKALGYVVVFDMAKEDYRMINLNTLISVSMGGQKFEVDHTK
jgi:hypothetical protein